MVDGVKGEPGVLLPDVDVELGGCGGHLDYVYVLQGHLLEDPISMHNAFLKEFEPFEESIIICRNEGALEDTIGEINQLFDNIAVCSSLVDK